MVLSIKGLKHQPITNKSTCHILLLVISIPLCINTNNDVNKVL